MMILVNVISNRYYRNLLTDESLNYLTLCPNLEKVYLEGNVCIEDYIECKKELQKKLTKIKILDGKILNRGENQCKL